jgi:hypothetical protein
MRFGVPWGSKIRKITIYIEEDSQYTHRHLQPFVKLRLRINSELHACPSLFSVLANLILDGKRLRMVWFLKLGLFETFR